MPLQGEAVRTPGRQPSALVDQGGRAHVQRAIAEFSAGRAVVVSGPDGNATFVLPVDGLNRERLAEMSALAGRQVRLVVSATRASALGADGASPGLMLLPPSIGHERVVELAEAGRTGACGPIGRGDVLMEAAVALCKLALLLPSVLAIPMSEITDRSLADQALRVSAADVMAFRSGHAASLRRVSSARVPLPGAADCEFVVFRDDLGQAWTLVRVGRPDTAGVVPVRLHSSCLTGDVFGSLRCDCGDQLRMAIEGIAGLGGGAVLYLDQEGCGLGLANKMRAYQLQDQGLDTVDANTTLGFERDERRYDTAARMLRSIGIARVALLTNNPAKLNALRDSGIDVVERIPLLAPVSGENRRYLDAKRRRAGHLMDDPTALPSDGA